VPYSYTKKQSLLNQLLEIGSYVLLLPFTLVQRATQKPTKKILLIEPFQMGDVLSLSPLIAPILKKFSGAEIFILTKNSSGSILEYDSRIKEVIKLDFPWSDYGFKENKLSRIASMLKRALLLRSYRFDLGIDTRGDVRSQILLALVGCQKRIGYLNYLHSNIYLKGLLLTDSLLKSKYKHRYLWNLELLTKLGIEETELFPIQFPSFVPDRISPLTQDRKKHIVIHIGGGWEYKRWSETKWAKLIDSLRGQSRNDIVVIAGPGEREVIERIKVAMGANESDRSLEFKITTLEEMIGLVNQCQQFIGLDSGPMNLAVCLNKKIVALFGPGDSTMWKPLNEGAKFIHKVEKFSCNPCMQTVCLHPNKSCMEEIEVEDVLAVLKE
jgi:ADP-heptose:LPS heptosyltransferase